MNEAWARTFDYLRRRKSAYSIFSSPLGNEVLVDLAKFCRANETCVIPGDRDRSLVLEGRREVWLRIQQHLHLTSEQMMALYQGVSLTKQE